MATINKPVGRGMATPPRDPDVLAVQKLINARISQIAPLARLVEDGTIGPRTIAAIEEFQRRVVGMRNPDGRVDPGGRTLRALNGEPVQTGSPPNRSAWFETVSRAGQTRQMMSGRITINHQTYDFRSGGHGRGNLPPGDYTVTPHLWDRSETGFSVGGVGFSFALSDAYDSRVGATRTLLRIHPDGGVAGTQGCIGIVGDAATQRRFREDMRAEFGRSNNRFTLTVQQR